MARKNTGTTLTGTVIARTVNRGSKSESTAYFIKRSGRAATRIELDGENPFEQPTLGGLVDRRCEAHGAMYRGRFLATRITPLP